MRPPAGKKSDRSGHEAARGKKMPTLADLSREMPTREELYMVFSLLETESDRGCALIAGCLLENTLALAIDCHFADTGPAFRRKLHEGSAAPLGTFASKIKIGRALGIYDHRVQTAFEAVKDVRNAFAHALRPLDFMHPAIVAKVKGLTTGWPKPDAGMSAARIRYIAFCVAMSQQLFDVANERGGREMPIAFTLPDIAVRMENAEAQ